MKMGAIKGHTAENGRGAKVFSMSEWPQSLQSLVERHHPDLLNDPLGALNAKRP